MKGVDVIFEKAHRTA